ncbi:hypothetical protein BMI91_17560 [Thioclava sediminum]|uniref:Uncharacterized protein n=1 Tax=Thioclava sediminum TaxID=1915319 RepID=A0ABX3MUB5_9RHOB|nr:MULTISPECIES: hypothetical protein [Thioclava]MAQ36179.1 hypothetical protein [Thioclava sp.]MPQ94546.1 hypothetical protein [Thioclava sp. JE_KL1]OOY09269.1 hypothetical protein BMI89_10040 [Thioclava sp. F36-7]OOY14524.1 hypothetical protein BMI85_17845 [Thioclava sp. DLFJ4-1]OOY20316.1 hypothetical protein BMI86_12805 [Thioclava sp. DLFJ5-1]
MAKDSNRQSSIGGLILTLVALVAALGVVVWLVADTPIDGGDDAATDPPSEQQMSDPNAAKVDVAPESKTSGPATGGDGQ